MKVQELKGIYVTRNKSGFSLGMEEAKIKAILSTLSAPEGVKLRVKILEYEARKFKLKFSLSEGYIFVNPNLKVRRSTTSRIRAQLNSFPEAVRALEHFRTEDGVLKQVGSVWILTIPPGPALLPAITKTYTKPEHRPPEAIPLQVVEIVKQETATVVINIGYQHTFEIPLREAFDLALRYAERGLAKPITEKEPENA